MRCHALQHGSRGLAIVYANRYLYQTVLGNTRIFGIAAQHSGVRDAIAYFERLDLAAKSAHHARRFLPVNEWERSGITSFAEVNVNKVDADRRDLDHSLVRIRRWNRQVDQSEDFRPSGFRGLYGFHGGLKSALSGSGRKFNLADLPTAANDT